MLQVCAEINGLVDSVSACADLSTQEIQAARQYQIQVSKNIMGNPNGTAAAALAASSSPSDGTDYVVGAMV